MNKKYKWFQFFQEKEDAAYTLPISSDVIERNPALKQNRLTTKKILQ